MQWKHWLNIPGESSLWMLRHAGRWLQEAGQREVNQWINEIEPLQSEVTIESQYDPIETELQ